MLLQGSVRIIRQPSKLPTVPKNIIKTHKCSNYFTQKRDKHKLKNMKKEIHSGEKEESETKMKRPKKIYPEEKMGDSQQDQKRPRKKSL